MEDLALLPKPVVVNLQSLEKKNLALTELDGLEDGSYHSSVYRNHCTINVAGLVTS